MRFFSSNRINFKRIIKSELRKFNKNSNYTVTYTINRAFKNSISIEFSRCTILLTLDDREGFIDCHFQDPKNLKGRNYHLLEAIKFNYIELDYRREVLNIWTKDTIRASLNDILAIIHSNLTHVMHGDFSWTEKADEFERKRKMIQDALNTVFVFDHPIYMKLKNNDPTWLDDLNSLKKS